MRGFFSVGEPSGDLHGANLIAELRSRADVTCVGYGGPRMSAAGCQLHADLTQLAVMWFLRAILNLPQFLSLLSRADRYFQTDRPDAVILIDYPGFNWWIARRAKAHGVPVVYYGTPQLWAWAPWRVKKMRRYTDHVLCKLPFEEPWFRHRKCHATYVGHPYFDELSQRPLDAEFLSQLTAQPGPLVTILPGSRGQEVTSNLPTFLKAAEEIQRQVPGVRFAIASFNERQAEKARQLVHRSRVEACVSCARTGELIHAAECCMACSGSVSLELLYECKPSVILYKISWLAFQVQRPFVLTRYITLVNLLEHGDIETPGAHIAVVAPKPDPVLPEFLTWQDKSAEIARIIVRWLRHPKSRQERVKRLRKLGSETIHPGASRRAAEYILEHVLKTRAGRPKSED